jgi:hypothetical protein
MDSELDISVYSHLAEDNDTPFRTLCKLAGMTDEEILEAEQNALKRHDDDTPKAPVLADGCKHIVEVIHSNEIGNPEVIMYNDDDGWYTQYFRRSEELLSFIKELQDAHDECFKSN